MNIPDPYQPNHKIRIVTAASLFDGHDAAINVMRRILQSTGGEIIHLGHHRSVKEIVDTAIQEDAQAIAISSYQGGHMEYFKYMHDLLQERGCPEIKIFGGGGGTILPQEQEELHSYGISRIYSPDDGRSMGLQGMINHLLENSDYSKALSGNSLQDRISLALGADDANTNVAVQVSIEEQARALGQVISTLENDEASGDQIMPLVEKVLQEKTAPPILGITGTGGAGKSSLVDEIVRRFLLDFDDRRIAIVSVDPTKRRTGGALLGDRIRMNAIYHERVFMRSMATRQSNLALSNKIPNVLKLLKAAEFDLIILETSGIGQSDTEIVDVSDVSMYVMTPEYGAASQLEKIDMLDFADVIAVNKFDKRGALDALRDVKKQYQRNRQLWEMSQKTNSLFSERSVLNLTISEPIIFIARSWKRSAQKRVPT